MAALCFPAAGALFVMPCRHAAPPPRSPQRFKDIPALEEFTGVKGSKDLTLHPAQTGKFTAKQTEV